MTYASVGGVVAAFNLKLMAVPGGDWRIFIDKKPTTQLLKLVQGAPKGRIESRVW